MYRIHSLIDSNLMLNLLDMFTYAGITSNDRDRIDAVTLLTHHNIRNLTVGH